MPIKNFLEFESKYVKTDSEMPNFDYKFEHLKVLKNWNIDKEKETKKTRFASFSENGQEHFIIKHW